MLWPCNDVVLLRSFSLSVLKPCYYPPSFSTTYRTRTSVNLVADLTSELVMTTIEESDVGITHYISKLPGFRGILKQRYSDFIVNEVDTEGNVVHLTSLEVPREISEAVKEKEKEIISEKGKSYVNEIEEFKLLAGEEDAQLLEGFINQINEGNLDSSHIVFSPDYDKAHRTAMHNFFKEKLKFLVTDTVDGPDDKSKCIRVRLNSGGNDSKSRGGGGSRNSRKRKDRNDYSSNNRNGNNSNNNGKQAFDSRGSDHWPDNLGKFLRFHLYKENKDTQEALGLLGKMLGIQPRSFGFAGTKDKRSVSTQRVTVFKQHASRVAALNDRLIGIKVGDFCHVKEELLLGQLLGNRFMITLRGVIADSKDTIKGSASSLGRHGFINYFGLQRFGSGSVPTHLIGAALLRGEWESAVSMILDPREGERDIVRKTREYYKETGDVDGTLRQLPRYLTAERAVLQCLKKCPGNYLQALKAVPRTLRMMYVHSYQSYLWNHAASMRVQKYGTDKVVVGDLVYHKEDDSEREIIGFKTEVEEDNCEDVDECTNLDETSVTELPERKNTPVKAVSAEDIATGSYTINDVILPIPGSRVSYPTNDIARVYHDLAEKDAINLTESVHSVKYLTRHHPKFFYKTASLSLSLSRTHTDMHLLILIIDTHVSFCREFSITSMTGSYRRVFQKPIDFEWEILSYTDGMAPLTETDLEKIAKAKSMEVVKEEQTNADVDRNSSDCLDAPVSSENDLPISEENNGAEGERETELLQAEPLCGPNSQGVQTALKLSFTLPSSCYATMAIRELLKTSTSVAFHKTLN